MGQRTGTADTPLHGGRVPAWLASRMARLGRVIVEAIVLHYGRREVLRRLSHPFWFQSFGAVMGMDWHSSGITTSVLGALKRGLAPVQHELGLYVCGGRGRHSRATPAELLHVGELTGLDGQQLGVTSRLVAKVDSAAVQDHFELYLHGFVVTADGQWAVVQQGMNPGKKLARRYHWLSEGLESFVDDPHQGIEGAPSGLIVNLADHRAAQSRTRQLELIREGPDRALAEVAAALPRPQQAPRQQVLPHLSMPMRHEVLESDFVLRRLHGALKAAATQGPKDFTELLMVPGVGARTLEALALTAEIVHGAPCRFSDPARFALAHGGKDGHPFPVPLKVYDETLRVLGQAVAAAKLGSDDKLSALARLDQQARILEQAAQGPSFRQFVARERAHAAVYGARSVGPDPE